MLFFQLFLAVLIGAAAMLLVIMISEEIRDA